MRPIFKCIMFKDRCNDVFLFHSLSILSKLNVDDTGLAVLTTSCPISFADYFPLSENRLCLLSTTPAYSKDFLAETVSSDLKSTYNPYILRRRTYTSNFRNSIGLRPYGGKTSLNYSSIIIKLLLTRGVFPRKYIKCRRWPLKNTQVFGHRLSNTIRPSTYSKRAFFWKLMMNGGRGSTYLRSSLAKFFSYELTSVVPSEVPENTAFLPVTAQPWYRKLFTLVYWGSWAEPSPRDLEIPWKNPRFGILLKPLTLIYPFSIYSPVTLQRGASVNSLFGNLFGRFALSQKFLKFWRSGTFGRFWRGNGLGSFLEAQQTNWGSLFDLPTSETETFSVKKWRKRFSKKVAKRKELDRMYFKVRHYFKTIYSESPVFFIKGHGIFLTLEEFQVLIFAYTYKVSGLNKDLLPFLIKFFYCRFLFTLVSILALRSVPLFVEAVRPKFVRTRASKLNPKFSPFFDRLRPDASVDLVFPNPESVDAVWYAKKNKLSYKEFKLVVTKMLETRSKVFSSSISYFANNAGLKPAWSVKKWAMHVLNVAPRNFITKVFINGFTRVSYAGGHKIIIKTLADDRDKHLRAIMRRRINFHANTYINRVSPVLSYAKWSNRAEFQLEPLTDRGGNLILNNFNYFNFVNPYLVSLKLIFPAIKIFCKNVNRFWCFFVDTKIKVFLNVGWLKLFLISGVVIPSNWFMILLSWISAQLLLGTLWLRQLFVWLGLGCLWLRRSSLFKTLSFFLLKRLEIILNFFFRVETTTMLLSFDWNELLLSLLYFFQYFKFIIRSVAYFCGFDAYWGWLKTILFYFSWVLFVLCVLQVVLCFYWVFVVSCIFFAIYVCFKLFVKKLDPLQGRLSNGTLLNGTYDHFKAVHAHKYMLFFFGDSLLYREYRAKLLQKFSLGLVTIFFRFWYDIILFCAFYCCVIVCKPFVWLLKGARRLINSFIQLFFSFRSMSMLNGSNDVNRRLIVKKNFDFLPFFWIGSSIFFGLRELLVVLLSDTKKYIFEVQDFFWAYQFFLFKIYGFWGWWVILFEDESKTSMEELISYFWGNADKTAKILRSSEHFQTYYVLPMQFISSKLLLVCLDLLYSRFYINVTEYVLVLSLFLKKKYKGNTPPLASFSDVLVGDYAVKAFLNRSRFYVSMFRNVINFNDFFIFRFFKNINFVIFVIFSFVFVGLICFSLIFFTIWLYIYCIYFFSWILWRTLFFFFYLLKFVSL